VFVANIDGTVSVISETTDSITATIDVGGGRHRHLHADGQQPRAGHGQPGRGRDPAARRWAAVRSRLRRPAGRQIYRACLLLSAVRELAGRSGVERGGTGWIAIRMWPIHTAAA
jgi:hypothetical protein